MLTTDGMYALYRELKSFLENPTPSRVKKFTTNYFRYFTEHYYNATAKWSAGASHFVTLTNAINSGHFSLDAFCVIFIGYYITQNKLLTQKTLNSIDKLKELNKFYTQFEMTKQIEYINKKIGFSFVETVSCIISSWRASVVFIPILLVCFILMPSSLLGNISNGLIMVALVSGVFLFLPGLVGSTYKENVYPKIMSKLKRNKNGA